jgi:WD40 repeat protein
MVGANRGLFRWRLARPDSGTLEISGRETIARGLGWRAFTFSPDGGWFAAANMRSNTAYVFDRTLTNRSVRVGPHAGIDAVALSPDAHWLATGSAADRQIKVWDARTGSLQLAIGVGAAPRAAFSGDGRWLVTFGDHLELREVGSWKAAPPLPWPQPRPIVGAAALSSDGRLLAAVTDLANIQLFDLATFQSLGVLRPPGSIRLNAIAFSPDGMRLAAVGATARLRAWDLRQVRHSLRAFGLDWDLPAPPPMVPEAATLRLRMDLEPKRLF